MKKITQFLSAILLFFTIITSAQVAGDVAQTFGKFPGFNDTVSTIATQADGKILVGGNFTAYNGVTENYIIRLNADGSKDASFSTGTGFNSTVITITTQADGKILVGGGFTTYNGVTENYIIRLNADGSKDASFSTGTGFNSTVLAIATQADGKILVGGGFTTYNGVTENYIIRLNADGSKDTFFSTGTGFNGSVMAITAQADGKILVGGNFTTYNGVTENRIIRLNANGSKDTSFSTGTGFNSSVRAITAQVDGKILVGGDFTTYNGVTENRIIRLNANGSKDTSFSTGTGFSGTVRAVTAQSDGKILVGGGFTAYNGLGVSGIIRLNTDGSKDASFTTGTGFTNSVLAIAAQADGKILVGGSFTAYNGVTENRIIRLNANGSKDTSFSTGTGFSGSVNTITAQADGKILVGGDFTTHNGVTENRIIRLNADGSKDTSFSTGTGFNGSVRAITAQADGKILVGGSFTAYNGVTENRIIRLNADGSKDTSFNTGARFNGSVNTITAQADGKILVGGNFTTYNGVTENRIIRLNANGSKDTSFSTGTGFNSTVLAIATQVDGKILVGGDFTTYNGVTENRIIRLNANGSKDTSFSTGTGFNGSVNTITAQADGKILVGGGFTTYNGVTENYIISLNADGSKDTSFSTGTGFNNLVRAITAQADGKIIVGGDFTTYNGLTENRIIRLNANGSKDTSFTTGTGFNSSVSAIATQADGKLLIGGNFTTYKNDNSSAFLIGLHTEVSLNTETFEQSTKVTIYPNPSNSIFNIAIDKNATVDVYDIVGKQIFSKNLITGENTIDLVAYEKGIYLAKITNQENQTKTIKLIKK